MLRRRPAVEGIGDRDPGAPAGGRPSLPAAEPEVRRGRLRASAIAAVVAGIFLVVRVVSSPAVAAHVRALPEDRRAWKDLIVRPFAAALLPFRTDDGYGVALYVAALCALALVALVILRLARNPGTDAGASRRSPA